MAYTAIAVEGGMFPQDLLDRMAGGGDNVEGQRPPDFGLTGSVRLTEEMQATFADLRTFREAFLRRKDRARESMTTLTREFYVIPLLEALGFGQLEYQRAALEAGGERYAISHRAGSDEAAPPVHIVAYGQELDRRGPNERRSPHAVVQEYLNRSEPLWGVVTNGQQFRVLRNSSRFTRPTYLEFDLDRMCEENIYAEFVLLFRLVHRTRFPVATAEAHQCYLEKYYQQGIEEGGRVKDKLRYGVEQALETLGSALLQHPESAALREAVESGRLDALSYYRELLRLVYRLLFLMVAEERKLLFDEKTGDLALQRVYTEHYSISALRDRADRVRGDDNTDLWQGLLTTFRVFRDDSTAAKLGMSALDGDLFGPTSCRNIDGAVCTNRALLDAVRALSWFEDDEGRGRRRRMVLRRANYGQLNVEELGSVYESLLDLAPVIRAEPLAFGFARGTERKTTGSYYTPPELVHELINSALVPVIEDRLQGAPAASREAQEAALLGIRVVDPACGSGHFILAAARRIAHELAKVQTGEEEPPPKAFRSALHQVIRSCVYGVDRNPLAVDLCKVALWIEGHEPGLPLTFLDHRVRCGDSLVGVFDLNVLEAGIPDNAFKPITGDDKAVARSVRDRNRDATQGQLALAPVGRGEDPLEVLAHTTESFAEMEERSAGDYHAKEQLFNELRDGETWWHYSKACDLWTAAFFTPLQKETGELVPTTADVRLALHHPKQLHRQLVGNAQGLAGRLRFFHWPLEFPEVFRDGGFDCVLGNPPWDQIQPEESRFFESIGREDIASLQGAKRKAAIERLASHEPHIAAKWEQHKRDIEAQGKFIREACRFNLTAVGKLNTYSLFAELCRELPAEDGRSGVIVPLGIATDDSTKHFFGDLVINRSLASLYGFENENKVFPTVHNQFKFCLLTLSGRSVRSEEAYFVFFARHAEHIYEEHRRFSLSVEDFLLLNPNTRTCPVFRTRRDAEITKAIFRSVPVFIDETRSDTGNPWHMQFRQGLFNMTSDSAFFRTRDELEAQGWQLAGNVFCRPGVRERFLPLYEAKIIWHFDHRFGTYDGQTQAQANKGFLPQFDDEQHANPSALPLARYWVSEQAGEDRLADRWDREWLLGWRDVMTTVNERSMIPCLIPRVAVGHKMPLLLPSNLSAPAIACLNANLGAFALDYVTRQKVGGTSLAYFYLKQFPVLPPESYEERAPWDAGNSLGNWFSPRVLELTYTAWDLQSFARDMGWEGPPFRWEPERRFLLRCELDAAFFHLYGIERDDIDYILDTFHIVKRKDEARFGEYRTKRVILEIYDAMTRDMSTGQPYQTRLYPGPADPAVAHPSEPPEWLDLYAEGTARRVNG